LFGSHHVPCHNIDLGAVGFDPLQHLLLYAAVPLAGVQHKEVTPLLNQQFRTGLIREEKKTRRKWMSATGAGMLAAGEGDGGGGITSPCLPQPCRRRRPP
jgi:hypothetical protein